MDASNGEEQYLEKIVEPITQDQCDRNENLQKHISKLKQDQNFLLPSRSLRV